VMLRGNGGQDIFYSAEDRYRLFLFIQEAIERYACRVHAYCLMTNHVHLAIQVRDIPLSRFMQNISFRYARWINRKYQRIGHLFQGRYKAILVDRDSYLMELIRYIHLNPVRAGMVDDPADYEWSSHSTYLGEDKTIWITSDVALSYFSDRSSLARKRYAEFVAEGIDEHHRVEFHKGKDDPRMLGDDAFMQKAIALSGGQFEAKPALCKVIRVVGACFGVTNGELCGVSRKRCYSEARGVAAWMVTEFANLTLGELAVCMKRDPSALSLQAKKIRERAMGDHPFFIKLQQMKSEIVQNNSIPHA